MSCSVSLPSGLDFNVRSWHKADKLTDLKVRYERGANMWLFNSNTRSFHPTAERNL